MMNVRTSNSSTLNSKALQFLDHASASLSQKDYHLILNILTEWHASTSLNNLFMNWNQWQKSSAHQPYPFIHILCFNVRGFNHRWGEVSLLLDSHQVDIIALGEVGQVDMSIVGAVFSNFKCFYQEGENAHGGVLLLIKNDLPAARINCPLSNICIVDLELEETIRLTALYAPASKSWQWNDLSPFISGRCIFMGDFNVDLEMDAEPADLLLDWMDVSTLGPVLPSSNTSLRSNRIIDYALAKGVDLTIQTYEGHTSSDHKPLFAVLACDARRKSEGSRTNWTVFSLVLSYTAEFWEVEWSKGAFETTYGLFSTFLSLLVARCKCYFPRKLARPSIPNELVKLLALSRSLSFKAKRKGDIGLREEANRLRNRARAELKRFQCEQLNKQLKERNVPEEHSTIFWSKTKRFFKATSSTLRGFVRADGTIIKDPQMMANEAADYYEALFVEPEVMRPHPYIDGPSIRWENAEEEIPVATYPEVINLLRTRKKKQSLDIHGLSPFILDKIPRNYWHMLLHFFNDSFAKGYICNKLKEVRMILLAKKDALCIPEQTRPISLLDSFLKVQERLFLNRFLKVLNDRGILPDNQSGFRAGHRLQTRVLLLIEQIASYMSNSSPVATLFVDFKSAFDQLWFEGCLGKLARMGIPNAYVKWIKAWLIDRRAVIEIHGKRSRWFTINRGGPQGSSLTPSIFITYHSDMADFIPGAMCFFFADDLAAVVAGHIGIKFSKQCLDLERRLHKVMEQLEFYSILSVQPINYSKTKAMFSARAVCYPNPLPVLSCGGQTIEWIYMFKYLGYWLTTKLGWGYILSKLRITTRQRTSLINSFTYGGTSSTRLRRVLFSTFVLPHFTWIFALFPLITETQRRQVSHLYYTLLKRVYHAQQWDDFVFSYLYKERSLDDLCFSYWKKYIKSWSRSEDGFLLLEQSSLNAHRSRWKDGYDRIRCLSRSKRFVPHGDVLGKALDWMTSHGTDDSRIVCDEDELACFMDFPESF